MALMGDLSDLSLPDLLYIFNLRGMTGRLTLQSGNDDALLYFQRGKLVHVTSSKISQHLGQLLVRLGKITMEQLGSALAMQASTHANQALGAILIDQGWISADDLNTVLTYQAEEVLYRVLSWTEGSFSFAGVETGALRLPLRDLNVEKIILEATRRVDEWSMIRARISSLDCSVTLLDSPTTKELADRLSLKHRIVIASIVEGAATLRQIAANTALDGDDIIRIAYELANYEILLITPPLAPAAGEGVTSRPRLPDNGHHAAPPAGRPATGTPPGATGPLRGGTGPLRPPRTTGYLRPAVGATGSLRPPSDGPATTRPPGGGTGQ